MSRLEKIVPEGWKSIKVGNVFKFLPTVTFSREDLSFEEDTTGIRNVHYGDIHATFNYPILDCERELLPVIVKSGVQESKFTYLSEGDLVIADASEDYEGVGASVELKNVGGKKITAGLHTFAARDNSNETAPGFRAYILEHPWVANELKKLATGSKVYGISKANFSELELILPSLPEQRKIARILSKWDELIETQIQLIKIKEKRKKGLMQKLLNGQVRFPGFEEEWEDYPLSNLASFSNGKAHENIVDEDGMYVLITSKFISTGGKEFRAVNERLSPLFKEDIVMVMSDVPNGKALAKCYFIQEDGLYSLNQRICQFQIRNGYPKFFFYLLNRNAHFLQFDSGVGQTNLRKDDILDCLLTVPRIEEQKAIADCLDAVEEEVKILSDELHSIKSQKKGLMQQLLTGKIRVNVG